MICIIFSKGFKIYLGVLLCLTVLYIILKIFNQLNCIHHVLTPALTLETYIKYLEDPLCLHSNNINSSSERLDDEMNVFNNRNCLHRYHPKFIVPNEGGLWFFQFINPLSRLIKMIEVVSKIKLLMLTDDQCTLQDTLL